MALKYLAHIETLNIDMLQNVLSNVVIHPLTTATRPATPIVGQTIYNGTLKALEVWDGTVWVSASGDITAVTAGTGLSGGGSIGAISLEIDYLGADNIILAAGALSGNITTTDYILISDATDSNAKKALVSTLPFTANLGTVTSISVAGNDGISVSGSPITTSGTITLGITNGSITNVKLANSTITIGTTVIALGATSTSLSGLTSLDFAAGARTIGASIGANVLTIGAATSTVVIPGNLTVSGTTTTINTETILLADNIITLNSNAAGAAIENAGIEVERGTDPNVSVLWDEAANRWTVGSESFVAGTFIGNLSGNATTATTLQTARTINGTSFNGSANITTANWGTARTITIGNTGKSVNGSANVAWSLAEIGAQAALTNPITGTGSTNYIPKFTGTSTLGNSQIFDNGTNIGIGTTSPQQTLHLLGFVSNGYVAGRIENIAPSGAADFDFKNSAQMWKMGVNISNQFRIRDDSNSDNVLIIESGAGANAFYIKSGGNTGIGTTTPTQKLHISGSARIEGALYDSNNSSGTSGQVLSSTATGTDWVDVVDPNAIPKDVGTTYNTNFIKSVTQAEYDAIVTKDPTTLYFIV
jgi:hypothetical protein